MAKLLSLFYLKVSLFFTDKFSKEENLTILLDLFRMTTEYIKPNNNFVKKILIKHLIQSFDFLQLITSLGCYTTGIFAYLIESDKGSEIEKFVSASKIGGNLDLFAQSYPRLSCKIYNKFKNSKYKETSNLWNKLEKTRNNFLTYIENKSIAIVGNSPCEIGKHRGKDIDNHDIVIRFNNYILDNDTTIDYGKKENIWCISPAFNTIKFRNDLSKYNFILSIEAALFSFSYSKLKYIKWLVDGDIPFFYVDGRYELRYKTNLHIISLGLYILDLLSKHTDVINKIDTYGFSFIDAENNPNRHYFKGDPVPTNQLKFHNWNKELHYYNIILQNLKSTQS